MNIDCINGDATNRIGEAFRATLPMTRVWKDILR
jgi:hypothetical protein